MVLALAFEAPLGGAGSDPWFLSGFQEIGVLRPLGGVLPGAGPGVADALRSSRPRPGIRGAGGRRLRRRRSLPAGGLLLRDAAPGAAPHPGGFYLRGPQGNAFELFESWDPLRPEPLPPVPLSEVFWCRWLGLGWMRRRAAGRSGSFQASSGWLSTSCSCPGSCPVAADPRGLRSLPPAGRFLTLSPGDRPGAGSVGGPLKMYGRWLLDVGHWLHLPELAFGF